MNATGPAVLALDELLCHLTPELLAEIRATAPAWLLDQAAAAVVETHRRRWAEEQSGLAEGMFALPADQHPAWVRLGALDALMKWATGRNDTCMHAPHPMRPEPIVSAAWKPGLVVCDGCRHLLAVLQNSAADRTCDGCGKVVAGPDSGDPMYPFTVTCGHLSYLVGVCRDCRYWETA